MKTILRSELESLLRVKGPCISLYVPLQPSGREGLGDRLRLEKAITKAEMQLLDRGNSKQAVEELTAPARRLHETAWWATRGQSLAVLLGPKTEHFWSLDGEIEEEAWGDNHFHVRPLLPFVLESDRFYLLAISEHHVQFYEGNSRELEAVQLKRMPQNVEDAVQAEPVDRASRSHATMSGVGGQRATFHGQGGQPDSAKVETAEFIAKLAEAVDHYLHQRSSPLVLATVKEILPLWSNSSKYRHTLGEIIPGNPDYNSPSELHQAAWPIVAHALRRQQEKSYEHLNERRGTPRTAVGLEKVLPAATIGRIETLFIDTRHPVFGRFDAIAGRVQIDGQTGGDRCDLLEIAIAETVNCHGNVYPLANIPAKAGPATTRPTSAALTSVVEALLRF